MIKRSEVEFYLNNKLGIPKITYQGLSYNCFICDHGGNKYNLEIELNNLCYHCWACNDSGHLGKLLNKYAIDNTWRNLSDFKDKKILKNNKEKIIEFPSSIINFYQNKQVLNYLIEERRIKKELLKERKVGFIFDQSDRYYNNIYFPFYENGKQVGACFHNINNKKYKNLGKLDYIPYLDFINNKYPITICEGIYDALSGINCIPLLGTDINDKILRFIIDKDIILAVDNTIEKSQYLNLITKINNSNVKSLILFDMGEYKDFNEYIINDKENFIKEYNQCYNKIKM